MKGFIVAVIGILTLIIGYLTHPLINQTKTDGWTTVLKTHPDGSVLKGSKIRLINALREGRDLKLAWGWQSDDKTLEHLAEPIWIAIINEKEVMVHLDPQVLSAIDWKTNSPNYADSTLHNFEWRVAIGTDGTFDAVWYNRKTRKVHRRYPQRHIMSWMVRSSKGEKNIVKPLFDLN